MNEDRVYLAMVENLIREGKTEHEIEKIISTVRKEDNDFRTQPVPPNH